MVVQGCERRWSIEVSKLLHADPDGPFECEHATERAKGGHPHWRSQREFPGRPPEVLSQPADRIAEDGTDQHEQWDSKPQGGCVADDGLRDRGIDATTMNLAEEHDSSAFDLGQDCQHKGYWYAEGCCACDDRKKNRSIKPGHREWCDRHRAVDEIGEDDDETGSEASPENTNMFENARGLDVGFDSLEDPARMPSHCKDASGDRFTLLPG